METKKAMTDKEKILKAINQKQQEIWPTDTGEMTPATVPNNLEQGWLNALKWMKDLINSLPVEQSSKQLCWNDMTEEEKSDFFFDLSHQKQIKQSSEDLKKAAEEYASRSQIAYKGIHCTYVDDQHAFIAGADWQKEQTINKACEWLVANVNRLIYYDEVDNAFVDIDELITTFKEAMEDEQ